MADEYLDISDRLNLLSDRFLAVDPTSARDVAEARVALGQLGGITALKHASAAFRDRSHGV